MPSAGDKSAVNLRGQIPNGHAIGYHTHPSGEINFSNIFTAMKNGANADTEWIRANGKGLYVGVMQGGVVKISFCGHNSTCSRDTSTDGAKGKVIK